MHTHNACIHLRRDALALPHLHRDWAHCCRVCTGAGPTLPHPCRGTAEGEWWGHFADGQLVKVLTMKETQWCGLPPARAHSRERKAGRTLAQVPAGPVWPQDGRRGGAASILPMRRALCSDANIPLDAAAPLPLQGKIFFNSTTGDHLEFTEEELAWWVHNDYVA